MQMYKGSSHSLWLRTTFFVLIACAAFICLLLLSQGSPWFILSNGTRNKLPINLVLRSGQGESGPYKPEPVFFPTWERKESQKPSPNSLLRCSSDEQRSITLVITYIDDRDFSSIPLLYHLYRQDFPDVVYCLPKEADIDEKFSIVTVVYAMNHGLHPYGCLAEVILRYPNSTGYLYLRDNVILNVWNLQYLSSTKIWESNSRLFTEKMFHEVRDINWIWWSTIWGMPACEAVYADINRRNSGVKALLSAYNGTSFDATGAMNFLLWNGKGSIKCYRRASAIFYLPRAYASRFANLTEIFHKHQTFSDIAIPTMLRMIELEENFEIIRGVDLGDIYGEYAPAQDESLFWRHYSSNVVYTAPLTLKFNSSSGSEEQRRNEAILLNHILAMREKRCKDITSYEEMPRSATTR